MRLLRTAATLGIAVLGLAGCSTSEVSRTENGRPVTESPAPATDVDACDVLPPQTLTALGLGDVTPVPITDETKPGCDWSGVNDYITASVTLWVRGADVGDASDDTVTIAGTPVQVWAISSTAGRYIAICGERSVTINYTQGKAPLAAKAALQLTMEDALAAYDCT